MEATLKIIALGFVLDEGTYLRDPWNWLDFFVVLTSLGSLIPGMANVSVIRTFRLFRPLRSLTMMPALKSIISTILTSMLNLGEIMILAFVFFYIFAILGVSLWNGDIHYRCYQTPEPVNGDWAVVENDFRVWGSRKWEVGYWGSMIKQYDDHPGTIDLSIVGSLYRDVRIENLQYGKINFDNLICAFLTVFQCLTLEGWTAVMYNFQDSSGKYISTVYFVAFVLMWALLFLNIIVAILFDHYEDSDDDEESDEIIELKEKAEELGIPKEVIDLIITKNIVIDVKSHVSVKDSFKRYCKSLVDWKNKIKYPKSNYFNSAFIKFMYRLVNHPSFNLFIFIVIGLNTITLSLNIYNYGSDPMNLDFLIYFNYIFFAIFTIELI